MPSGLVEQVRQRLPDVLLAVMDRFNETFDCAF
jgi:hypothetical protein